MPGTATITISGKQWVVTVSSTAGELASGLGGIDSIPSGSGMLFDLGSEQGVQVTTEPMLFNIDVIFIRDSLEVVGVVEDVAPGHVVTEDTPVRYFLEVNAGEAEGIQTGDIVEIQDYEYEASTISKWIPVIMGISLLGFVGIVMGRILKGNKE